MRIIGEDLHLMNPAVFTAITERDEKTILSMAQAQVDGGADCLDLNLGQNRKLGKLTPWVIETIQAHFDIPFLLSSHVLKQQRALEIHQGKATINAVTANPTELPKAMATAAMFNANLVVILVSPTLTPMHVDGRLELAMQVMDIAIREKFPLEQLHLDPLISCRPDPRSVMLSAGLPDISTAVDSIYFLGELSDHTMQTIVPLSQSSMSMLPGTRSRFHCQLLPMLADAGLDNVILNCRDKKLMTVSREMNIKQAA